MDETNENVKTVELNISPEELKKFLGNAQDELTKEAPKEEEKDKPERVTMPHDKTFAEEATVEKAGMELIREGAVTVTETDKILYLKAILNDVPVVLDVPMLGGQFNVTVRSRSTYDQTVIFNALKFDEREDKIKTANEVLSQMQKYGAVTMLNTINNVPFERVVLNVTDKMEDSVTKLRKAVDDKIQTMSLNKWIILSNALSVFELKLYKLSEECVNKDFWNPLG